MCIVWPHLPSIASNCLGVVVAVARPPRLYHSWPWSKSGFRFMWRNGGEFGGRRRTKDEEERIDLRRGPAAGLEPVACRRDWKL